MDYQDLEASAHEALEYKSPYLRSPWPGVLRISERDMQQIVWRMNACAHAVLELVGRCRELEQEVKDADDEARRMREAYADCEKEWAEGGKAWKLEQENRELWAEVNSYRTALIEEALDEVSGEDV